MKLYHVTTEKKAKQYRQSGMINAPVRGFTTLQAAMAWAMKVGRTVILEFDATFPHKLPDHHNRFGEAWWNDQDQQKGLLLRLYVQCATELEMLSFYGCLDAMQ